MKFNIKFKSVMERGVSSQKIRKILTENGYSVKAAKQEVRNAIDRYRGHRSVFHVKGLPYITVCKDTDDSKVRSVVEIQAKVFHAPELVIK